MMKSCRRLWRVLLGSYVGLLVLWVLLCHGVGQAHFLVAPLTYLPRFSAGLGLVLLALPGWWWGRRAMVALLVGAVFYWVVLLDWRLPRPFSPQHELADTLCVAVTNCGDFDPQAWEQWLAEIQPDLVALTDVRGRVSPQAGSAEVAGLPHLRRLGEHVLASRHPITQAALAWSTQVDPETGTRPSFPPAARFEVALPQGAVAVYVVHPRSPRSHFDKYLRLKAWRWTLFGLPQGARPSDTLDYYWREQGSLLTELLRKIRADPLPVLVMGDWNLPDFGPRFREVTRTLLDAHRTAGVGYGYTFPGDVQHWSALGLPWLRIDSILTDRDHWHILQCIVQANPGDSQHCGVMARVGLR